MIKHVCIFQETYQMIVKEFSITQLRKQVGWLMKISHITSTNNPYTIGRNQLTFVFFTFLKHLNFLPRFCIYCCFSILFAWCHDPRLKWEYNEPAGKENLLIYLQTIGKVCFIQLAKIWGWQISKFKKPWNCNHVLCKFQESSVTLWRCHVIDNTTVCFHHITFSALQQW